MNEYTRHTREDMTWIDDTMEREMKEQYMHERTNRTCSKMNEKLVNENEQEN